MHQLAGEGGIKRSGHALHETRSRFADKTESSSLLSSSYHHTPSSGGLLDSSASSDAKKCDVVEDFLSAQHDGASLLKLHSSSSNQNGSLTPKRTQNFSKTATMPTENEILLNEIFHERPGFDILNHNQIHIKVTTDISIGQLAFLFYRSCISFLLCIHQTEFHASVICRQK